MSNCGDSRPKSPALTAGANDRGETPEDLLFRHLVNPNSLVDASAHNGSCHGPPMPPPIRDAKPAIVATHKQPASATARKPGDCELILEGKSIERLVLLDPHGLTKVIPSPGASVFLPPGRYVLQQVDFRGWISTVSE